MSYRGYQCSEKKALVLSVPYSKGFTGLCGRERNQSFSEGEYHVYGSGTGAWSHEIRLTYCTPYLKAGMLLSVLGLVIYVMLVLRKKVIQIPLLQESLE